MVRFLAQPVKGALTSRAKPTTHDVQIREIERRRLEATYGGRERDATSDHVEALVDRLTGVWR